MQEVNSAISSLLQTTSNQENQTQLINSSETSPSGSRVSSVRSGWKVHSPHDVPSSQLAAIGRDHS